MKTLFFLLAFVAAIFANDCYYVSSDSKWYYDLSSLEIPSPTAPYSYQTLNGTYYFNFCDDVNDLTDVPDVANCPQDSAICLKGTNSYAKLGDENDVLFSDSPYGVDKGLEVMYGSGDICASDNTVTYKTIVRLNCSSTESLTVRDIQVDGCTTTILAESIYACPVAYDSAAHRHHRSAAPIVLVCLLLCCLALCCCCCIRRCKNRACRQQNRRCCKLFNKGYTNVECQTFSESSGQDLPVGQVPAIPVPQQASLPVGQAPQYFMMYPPQGVNGQYAPPMYFVPQQQPIPTPVALEQAQLSSDEAYARQLQEQLNKE